MVTVMVVAVVVVTVAVVVVMVVSVRAVMVVVMRVMVHSPKEGESPELALLSRANLVASHCQM